MESNKRQRYKHDYNSPSPNDPVEHDIQELRNEVQSVQKSVALIIRCLPHVVHGELVAHECKCRSWSER
jgi:hypothetical protein